MNDELKQVLDLLKGVRTITTGLATLEKHFTTDVLWSKCKEEWKHMTKAQKRAFVRKAINK